MQFSDLVATLEKLEETDADLELVDILADLFRRVDEDHLPLVVTMVRGKTYAPWEPVELGVSSALAHRAVSKATGIESDQIEEWWREAGDLGDAAARAVANRTQQSLFTEELTVRGVHETLRELAAFQGEGSEKKRIDTVAGLVSNAGGPVEAKYVVRLVLEHMRLGVGEGTVRDAIAKAFLTERNGQAALPDTDGSGFESDRTLDSPSDDSIAAVERAHQVTNDFRVVAETARDEGEDGLAALDVELFRPIRAMLAQKAEGLDDALTTVADDPDRIVLDEKYDGIRAQIHYQDGEVRLFTRRLADVTDQFPEVVSAVETGVTAERAILEGELVAYEPGTQDFVPFQRLSKRVKRKYDVAELAEEIPVVCYLFDAVLIDDATLLDAPLRTRLDELEATVEPTSWDLELARSRRYQSREDAQSFYASALDAGHEGVMLKNLDASYQPGRRVGYMMKVKPTMEPLDLVITRAKYSEGRRSELLGRLYLACYDAHSDEFLEVGRLSTGYTDEELEDLTRRLEDLIEVRNGREVRLRPEIVVEVLYEEIQESPEYGSGYALRFPRFERVRKDLSPREGDTYERVERLFKSQ